MARANSFSEARRLAKGKGPDKHEAFAKRLSALSRPHYEDRGKPGGMNVGGGQRIVRPTVAAMERDRASRQRTPPMDANALRPKTEAGKRLAQMVRGRK